MPNVKPWWDDAKKDIRPHKGTWAPGDYVCVCFNCKKQFIGAKRAITCAPCAYGDETK